MFILQPEKLGQQTRSINNSNFPEPTVWATSDNCSKSYLLKSSFGFLLLLLPINCLVGHFPGFVYHVSKAHGLELSNKYGVSITWYSHKEGFWKTVLFYQQFTRAVVSSTKNPLTDVTSHITTTYCTWFRFRTTVS